MRKIKKVFILSFLSFLILSGCGKKHEEDAERLDEIDSKIALLFNEDSSDLADDVSEEQLEEIDEVINKEDKTKFNEENEQKMKKLISNYTLATDMYKFDLQVKDLFEDDVLKEKISNEDIDEMKEELKNFDEKEQDIFVARQSDLIKEAEKQSETMKEAESLVNDLFTKEDEVKEDATRENEEKAQEAITKVKNEELKEKLSSKLDKVDEELTKREETARKKKEEEQKKKEEEERKRKEEEERKKAAKSIGDFAGYYHDEEENELITITEKSYAGFIPYSDVFFDFEIVEIIHNSGTEISLVIHQDEYDMGGMSFKEMTTEVEWRLLDDGKFLDTGDSFLRRIDSDEFKKIETYLD